MVSRFVSRWAPLRPWPLTESKFDRILDLCKDKDVLDCGCIGSKMEGPGGMAATSHYRIVRAARHCVGVDIDEGEVAKRQEAGYDVRLANVETMQLGETFDVVVAADIIEHVSNAGRFLDQVKKHLRGDGFLGIVTPNPFSVNTVVKSLLGVQVVINAEHTCWYDPVTLGQLLDRHGFTPVEWYWQDYQSQPLATLAVRIRRNLAAHFIVLAKVKNPGGT